jgi:predicted nucleotidyltransferase
MIDSVADVESTLFKSRLQPQILGLLLLNEQRGWTARELTDRLNATPVAVHRELHRALRGGLVTREAIGRTYVYRAATESPLYEPLRQLLERTVGVEVELGRALASVAGVAAAFIHGSYAKGTKVRPTSDVDLLVLGNVNLHDLRSQLRQVEARVGREIDVLAYEPSEFADLARGGNSLARGILRGPVIPVIGTVEQLRAA